MKSSFLLNTFIVLLADVSCASFVLFTNIFTLVRSVITPRLDYCSSLYFCLPSSRRVFLLILLFAKLTEHIPKYGHVSSYVLPILMLTIISLLYFEKNIPYDTDEELIYKISYVKLDIVRKEFCSSRILDAAQYSLNDIIEPRLGTRLPFSRYPYTILVGSSCWRGQAPYVKLLKHSYYYR